MYVLYLEVISYSASIAASGRRSKWQSNLLSYFSLAIICLSSHSQMICGSHKPQAHNAIPEYPAKQRKNKILVRTNRSHMQIARWELQQCDARNARKTQVGETPATRWTKIVSMDLMSSSDVLTANAFYPSIRSFFFVYTLFGNGGYSCVPSWSQDLRDGVGKWRTNEFHLTFIIHSSISLTS